MADTVRVFVSYSHADARYLEKKSLLGCLRGLEKEDVTFWTDREIKAGELWDDVIKAKIQASRYRAGAGQPGFSEFRLLPERGNPAFPGAQKASVSDHSVAM